MREPIDGRLPPPAPDARSGDCSCGCVCGTAAATAGEEAPEATKTSVLQGAFAVDYAEING